MDSRNCSRNESLDAIRQKISSGELTLEEMNRRLTQAIDAEIMKPPVEMDIAFLKSCQDLQYALNNSTEYVSKAPQYAKELREYTEKKKPAISMPKRLGAAIGIAASLFVLLIVGDGILHREWLTGDSTPDQQQYVIEGHVVDPGLVTSGSANPSAEEQSLTTTSIEEVEGFMGFAPPQPTWLPEGWALKEYRCYKFPNMQWVSSAYENDNESYQTIIDVKTFHDAESAIGEMEQNAHGNIHVINGNEVYCSVNHDMTTAVWLVDTTSYIVLTPLSEKETLKLIESIN